MSNRKAKPTQHRNAIKQILNNRRAEMNRRDDFEPKGLDYTRDGDVLELLIYDVIGDFYFGGVSALDVATLLKENRDADIVVRINSPGGDVFDGVAIYNTLAQHPGDVEIRIDGLAASAASLTAMAGDRVVMGAAADLMIHRAWTIALGNEGELDAVAELLRKLDLELAKVYSRRSGLTLARVQELLVGEGESDGTWLSADEAIDLGFADESTEADESDVVIENSIDVDALDSLRIAAFLPTRGKTMAKPKLTRKERLGQQSDDEQQTTNEAESDEQTADEGESQVDEQSTEQTADEQAGDEQQSDEQAVETAEPAATFAELHELAGDDSAFIVEQQKIGASIGQARAAFVAHVKQQRDDAVEAKAAAEKQLADVKAAATIAGDAESDGVSGNADEGKRRGKFVDLINLRSAGDLN